MAEDIQEPGAQASTDIPERISPIEEKRQLVAGLLREVGKSDAAKFQENVILREKWIEGLIDSLKLPVSEGQDYEVVPVFADASLAYQPNRGFFAAFSSGLSQSPHDTSLTPALKHDNIEDFKRIASLKPPIPMAEIGKQREPGPRWVRSRSVQGEKRLVTNTRIDGVQIMWDGSAISKSNSTDRTIRPILIISK